MQLTYKLRLILHFMHSSVIKRHPIKNETVKQDYWVDKAKNLKNNFRSS